MNKKSFIITLFIYNGCFFASQAPWFSPTITLDVIKNSLSKKEFSVDSYNQFGLTGLMVAADKGNIDLAKILLKAGANIHLKSKDKFSNTALHLVVSDMNDANNSMRLPLLEFLLENGANAYATNYKGQVPLHCLITVDNVANMIQPLTMLIFYGTPCNNRDGQGATFLHNLVELRSSEMLAVARRHYSFLFDETLKNKENLTPLGFAEYIRCDECIIRFSDPSAMYQKISIVNNYDINGLTYLMVAAMTNDFVQAEKYVLDKGDINLVAENLMRHTALHYALAFKNIQMVQWLLGKQARVDVQNARGYTPAHLFIIIGSCDNSQSTENRDIFLKTVAKDPKILNMQDYAGNTILHTLAQRNNSSLIAILSDLYLNSMDFSIRNNDLETALEIAERLEYVPSTDILRKAQEIMGRKE